MASYPSRRDGSFLCAPLFVLLLTDCVAFSPVSPALSSLVPRPALSILRKETGPVLSPFALFCANEKVQESNIKESIAEVEMSHVLEGGTLVERLERTMEELRNLQSSVKADIRTAEDVLSEKKRVLEMLDDRMRRLNRELLQAQVEEQTAGKQKTAGIIVGDGRVGHALKEMGMAEDVTVRSTSELRYQLKQQPGGGGGSGPIYLCVPNKVLREVIEATPEHRREDLVFMGSGHLAPLLAEFGLDNNTQAFLFFAIPKLGATPVDGHTPNNPEGLTCATGKWAEDLVVRLRHFDLRCTILHPAHFRSRGLRRLIWTCAVHAVGKLRAHKTVGAVAEGHGEELVGMMRELAGAAESELGEAVPPDALDDLLSYTHSVADFPVVMKDLTFRNGFFYELSQAATNSGRPDPCPTHSKALRKIKAVK